MSTNQPDIKGFQRAVATALHEHWKLYLVEGVVLIVCGILLSLSALSFVLKRKDWRAKLAEVEAGEAQQ